MPGRSTMGSSPAAMHPESASGLPLEPAACPKRVESSHSLTRLTMLRRCGLRGRWAKDHDRASPLPETGISLSALYKPALHAERMRVEVASMQQPAARIDCFAAREGEGCWTLSSIASEMTRRRNESSGEGCRRKELRSVDLPGCLRPKCDPDANQLRYRLKFSV